MQILRNGLVGIAFIGLLLTGCAGGGGGGGPTTSPPPPPPPPALPPASPPNPPASAPFTSWNTTVSPGTYALNGGSTTVAKAFWFMVNPHLWGSISSADQTVVLTFNGAGDLADAAIVEGQKTIMNTADSGFAHFERNSETFGLGSGSLVTKQIVRGDEDTEQMRVFTYADPTSAGLSYMTFGWWMTGEWSNLATTDKHVGFSAGALTSGSAIPTSGSAQFTGALTAEGVDTSFSTVAAPVTINVDFAARSAAFSSGAFRNAQGVVQAGTALTGVLTYGSQQNALTGQLTSTVFAGPANGHFYGPAAEEIGGSFVLAPTDPNANGRVIGGFGAKR